MASAGRKVAQGSAKSKAQSRLRWKKHSSQVTLRVARLLCFGTDSPLLRGSTRQRHDQSTGELLAQGARRSRPRKSQGKPLYAANSQKQTPMLCSLRDRPPILGCFSSSTPGSRGVARHDESNAHPAHRDQRLRRLGVASTSTRRGPRGARAGQGPRSRGANTRRDGLPGTRSYRPGGLRARRSATRSAETGCSGRCAAWRSPTT